MRDLANALNNAAAAWEPGARNFGKIASENMLLCVDKLQQTGFSVSEAVIVHSFKLQSASENFAIQSLYSAPVLVALAALWLFALGTVSNSLFGKELSALCGSNVIGTLLLMLYVIPGIALVRAHENLFHQKKAFRESMEQQRLSKRRGMRRVKTFCETKYSGANGNPNAAKDTLAAAQDMCDSWLNANRQDIDVVKIQVTVDSKNHSGLAWYP